MKNNHTRYAVLVALAVFQLVVGRAGATTFAQYDFSTDGPNGSNPTTLNDTSGNNRDAVAGGANLGTIVAGDKPGWSPYPSMQLPTGGGIADYTPSDTSPFNSTVFNGSSDFTLEMAVKFLSFVDNHLFSTVFDPGNEGFHLSTSPTGVLSVSTRDGTGSVTGPTLQTGQWYHLAVTYDAAADDVLLYVNQSLVGSDLSWTFNANTDYGFVLGQFKPGTGVYTGLKYNWVRISDEVLSPLEFTPGVPEPSAAALILVGGAIIGRACYRRKGSRSV